MSSRPFILVVALCFQGANAEAGEGSVPAVLWQYQHGMNPSFGTSVSGLGDINGDGFADVAIGVPDHHDAYSAVRVIYGHSYCTGGRVDILRTADVDSPREIAFGESVAGAGDVNGDGFEDMLVGAPTKRGASSETGTKGRAYIFLGGEGGLRDQEGIELEDPEGTVASGFGREVVGVGDVDGDGFADVAVAEPPRSVVVYRGSESGIIATPHARLAGYEHPDVVGIDGWDPSERASADDHGIGTAILFGESLTGGGDIDGDGYSDIVVGARLAGPVAVVYYGGKNWPDASRTQVVPQDGAGQFPHVSLVGDTNCDGHDDLLVGRMLYRGSKVGVALGQAEVLAGDESGFGVQWDNAPHATSASGHGDVDADGCSDVALGIHHSGVVRVYSSTGTNDLRFEREPWFGLSVDWAGDFDGNGVEDLAIGAPNRPMSNPAASAQEGGEALIYLLGTEKLSEMRPKKVRRVLGCRRKSQKGGAG